MIKMLRLSLIGGLFLLLQYTSVAQETEIPRDTSFTIYSNYQKLRKKYPFVTPITPNQPRRVKAYPDLVYRRFASRELHLDLFVPQKRTRKGYPGVILIHGGGWSSGSKAHLIPMAQQLAARGIIAATVEYRLSPEAIYPAAVHDLQEAIRWLRANAAQYQLDTAHMAALGCSAGAQLASLIGTMPQTLLPYPSAFPQMSAQVQAVVNIDGIVSFVHPEADAEGVAAGKWLGGTRQSAAKQWREASALEYLNASTPPFLFVNSAVPRFHAGRDDFAAGLARYGTYYEIHTIPDTPHGFWLVHPWDTPTLEYTAAFLHRIFPAQKPRKSN